MAGFVLSDEIVARRELLYYRHARNPLTQLGWLIDNVAHGESVPTRLERGLNFALHRREFVREGFQNTCEVAQRFAQRLDMSEEVQAALLSVVEQWAAETRLSVWLDADEEQHSTQRSFPRLSTQTLFPTHALSPQTTLWNSWQRARRR